MTDRLDVQDIGDSAGLPLSDLLRYHADRDPGRPALIMGENSLSRRELDQRSNRLAWAMMEHGVKPDDFVTIALPNGFEFFIACFAAWKCGATPNPVSARMPVAEMQAAVDLAAPALMIGGPEEIRVRKWLPADFDASAWPDTQPPSRIARYWKVIGSGGSTGKPKLIVSHVPAQFDPRSVALGQQVDGTILNPGPLYHNGPFMCSMLALYAGNSIVIMERFDEREALRLIERHKVDFVFFVPTMMNRIWRLDDEREQYDVSSIRTILHTASVCPVWLKQAWIDWLGPERILEGYGATEQQGGTMITGTDWLRHQGSVGRALPGATIQILDPDGRPLPPGEIGEIFFQPDDPARTTYHYLGAEARTVGHAQTAGDMGWLDEDGWLFIADRRTDMIVSGGANIYPAEVEAVIDACPAARSSVVVGLPHDDMIAIAHAIVQIAPDADTAAAEAELRGFLKERLVPYKIPRSFEFVRESLRDDAGKVRRSQLRDERIARLATT